MENWEATHEKLVSYTWKTGKLHMKNWEATHEKLVSYT